MKRKLTSFIKKWRGLILSFIAALMIVFNLVMLVVNWNSLWSKVFGGISSFLFSLMDILAFVCVALVVCCAILVITALIYCTFFEDEDIANEKEKERHGR